MFVLYSNFMAENKSLRKTNLLKKLENYDDMPGFVKKHKPETKENVLILENLKTFI